MSQQIPSNEHAIAFVYREARILDEKQFDVWYEMFTEDAFYWIPLVRDQVDGLNHTSLMYEDKLLLKVRIERLKNPRTHSQGKASFCQHVLQQPMIEKRDDTLGELIVRTPFVYLEAQGDEQFVLGAISYHHLIVDQDDIRIQHKKVALLNPDAGHSSIQLFL